MQSSDIPLASSYTETDNLLSKIMRCKCNLSPLQEATVIDLATVAVTIQTGALTTIAASVVLITFVVVVSPRFIPIWGIGLTDDVL